MNLTDKELESHQHFYAMSAYEQNRAAARELEIAEAGKGLIVEEIRLKKYMANLLYLVGASQMLEAQLYVISGIHSAVTSGNTLRWKSYLELLKELLRKIRAENAPLFTDSVNTAENQKDQSVLSNAWMAYRQDSVTLRQFRSGISPELRMSILHKCMILDRERIVAMPDCTGLISAFVSLNIGDSSLISEVLLGCQCYTQKPKICEVLNKIIKDALNYYSKGEYSKFLHSLSTFYDRPKWLMAIKEVRHINKCKISLDIRPAVIVTELLKHDFLPEGVAYFLVLLIGPHLKPKYELPTNIRLELPKYFEFYYFATKLFEEVWTNRQLTERAKEIDRRLESTISIIKTNCIECFSTATLNEIYSVPNDYIKERLIIPVIIRS